MTTFNSYGHVAHHRQIEIMNDLAGRTGVDEGATDGAMPEAQVQDILNNLAKRLRGK